MIQQSPSTAGMMLQVLETSALLLTVCVIAFEATQAIEWTYEHDSIMMLIPAMLFAAGGTAAAVYLIIVTIPVHIPDIFIVPFLALSLTAGGVLMLGTSALMLYSKFTYTNRDTEE